MKKFSNFKQAISLLFLIYPVTHSYAEDICRFNKIESRGWYGGEGLDKMDLRPQHTNSAVAVTTGSEIHATLFKQMAEITEPYLGSINHFDTETSELFIDLNPNCKWSDGAPIVAEDFLLGLQTLYSTELKILPSLDFIKNGQAIKDGKEPIENLGFRIEDKDTIVYTLNVPPEMAEFVLSTTPYAPLPSHAIQSDANYFESPVTEQVYSGPFRVQSKLGNEGIRLERNPYFCSDQELLVDEVDIYFGSNYEKNADKYLSEGVDLMGDLSTRLRGVFNSEGTPESYTLAHSNVGAIMWLTLNYKQEVFKDPRIREAIRLTYDPATINKGRIGILASKADTLTVRTPQYNPPVFPWSELPYPESVAKARALMEEAGYGPDNRLKMVFTGPPITEHISIGSFFQSILNQIYIDLEVPPPSVENHVKLLKSEVPAYHFNVYYWFADFPDPFSFMEAILQNHFHSEEISEELRTMLQNSNGTDNENRLFWLRKMEELLIEDGYIMPGGIPERVWLSREGVEFKYTPYPTARDLAKFDCASKSVN